MKSKLGKKMDRIRKTELEDANPIKTKDSVTLSKKEYLRPFIISILFLFWRHGRVVRRGTANPFSPVQIRVSPDQHNKWLGILLR